MQRAVLVGISLGDLARELGATLYGDGWERVDRIEELATATPGSLSFLSDRKRIGELGGTQASAVLLREEYRQQCPVPVLVVEDPYLAFARAARLLYPPRQAPEGVHSSAQIAASTQLGVGTSVGPNCILGEGVVVGEGTRLGPGCILEDGVHIGRDSRLVARVTLCREARLGDRNLIHPGAVIGGDGFGFANEGGHWLKIPQVGGVVLGDDVEVGCNSTIDRGAVRDTRIGDGVKIDNLVQIAHNVVVGEHTIIAGCVGIAGSARVGRHCALGGGVGVSGHLEICDHVTVLGMSLVSRSIHKPGAYGSALPSREQRVWQRAVARFWRLDDLVGRVRRLESDRDGA